MNTEIIAINTNETGIQSVSARELYEKLGLAKSQFARWAKQNIIENTFAIEHDDWERLDMMSKGFAIMANGNETTDYALSIPFAKKLAMQVKTAQGETVRNYFLECERQARSKTIAMPNFSNPAESARAWALEYEEKQKALCQIEQDKPKVLFADSVTTSKTEILVGELAKLLKQNGINIGQNRMFEWLRDHGYLMKGGSSRNMPTQQSMDMDLFRIKETTINTPNGNIRITKTPKITGKGQVYFINKFLAHKEMEAA